MRTTISTIRQLAAAGLLAAAAAAPAGNAYLPITGPAPLRFEVAFVRPAVLALAPAPEQRGEKSDEPTPFTTRAAPTNTPEEIHYSAGETNASPAASAETEMNGPSVIHPSADNLLVITPQMLAEYFKPAPGATNAAGGSVFLPVAVGFTPPTEKPPVRSRATYKTE